MTIAEIIAQGKRLEASYPPFSAFSQEEVKAAVALRMFYIEHGSRLLRIAEAAAALDFDGALCDGDWTTDSNAYRYNFPKDPINRLRAAIEEDANA